MRPQLPTLSGGGVVVSLHRYPVKSMAGESLDVVRVLAEHGLQGDRAFAVVDVETGRVASAKHPRRWGGLLGCTARFVGELNDEQRRGPVVIGLPGGVTVRSDDGDVDAALSAAFGRAVRLADAPPSMARFDEDGPGQDRVRGVPLSVGAGVGTFFDLAPIHLVTTATLARLRELRPASDFSVARFRPNLVIDTGEGPGFVENDWLGQVITIGDGVRLCVTFPCARCVMATLAQPGLAADAAILRTAAEHNLQMFALRARMVPAIGVYAAVIRGGTIRPGDAVRLDGRSPLRRAAAFVHAVKRAVRRR